MPVDPVCGMNVDEKGSLRLVHGGREYFFCSANCLKKFAQQNDVSEKKAASCLSGVKRPLYRNKTFLVVIVLLFPVLLSYAVPLLEPFRRSLWMYFKVIWWAVILGLALGGLIDYYVPREYISYIMARPGRKSNIFNAVILGFFMSVCSHGILALAIQLYKKGASTASVVAFLLASPWANLPLTIMLIVFFGLIKGLYIIVSAVVIALVSGFIFQFLETKGLVEKNPYTSQMQEGFSLKEDIGRRLRQYKPSSARLKKDITGVYRGSVSLSNMILWWILIGMGLASFAGAYVPDGFFMKYMGPTTAGLVVTLIAATIIEVCSEGSAPLAFEIFRQTGALGNSFAFLMAGVATDYTEIGLLWHNIGRRTALWLPVVTVPQVIVLGILANAIFS